jgi:transcriptional regulator of aroF, aroG, tyrA and aromatic amino acid transport
MRIHVSFIDRVGITQEVLALLGGRNLNLDAVEMIPPNVYIDAPTLSPEVLEELKDALFRVLGVEAVTVVDILPGQRRHLQLDALLAAMTDPVLALDSAGKVLLANPALIALYGREPAGESVAELFNDPGLLDTLLEQGFRLPLREITVNGQTLLLDATPITDAGALLTLYQPNRIGEQLSALHHDHAEGFDALLGESPAIRTLKARAQRVAALDAPLLIQGETGTGKELVARACHAISARHSAPFLALNCAALPENLAESELFGYAPGAFTGAARGGKPGLMELANQGTVFLDEIGEMSPYLQANYAALFSTMAASVAWAAIVRSRSTCASSARLIATWKKWSAKASSAKICSIASTCSMSKCRRCANVVRTFCCWRATSCSRPVRRSSVRFVASPPALIRRCSAIAGRATCDNCRT